MRIKDGVLLSIQHSDIVDGVLTIPEGVEVISRNFLENVLVSHHPYYPPSIVTDLKEIVVPDSLKEIKEGAFRKCTDLEVIHISNNTIQNAKGLPNEKMYHTKQEETDMFQIEDGVLVKALNKNAKTIVIPKEAKTIGDYTFSGFDKLENVYIHYDVKNIGKYAFKNCTNLKYVNMHYPFDGNYSNKEKNKNIGVGAFAGCKNLKYIKFPRNLEKIKKFAFSDCESLFFVDIPKNLKKIESFAFKNCNMLMGVSCPQQTYVEKDAFQGCPPLKSARLSGDYQHRNYIFENDKSEDQEKTQDEQYEYEMF